MTDAKTDIITLDIESFADKGVAVARLEGRVVFVPFAAPGDKILARYTKQKRSYAQASLVEILTPSPLRTQPRCDYYGRCGGCSWQHLGYQAQLRGKAESFAGFCATRLGIDKKTILAPIASPCEYGYRNRVALGVAPGKNAIVVGFKLPRSRELISIKRCPVLTEELNAVLEKLETALNPHSTAIREAMLSTIKLQQDATGAIWPVFEFQRRPANMLLHALSATAAKLGLSPLYIRVGKAHRLIRADGKDTGGARMPFTLGPFPASGDRGEDANELKMGVPVGGFVQANSGVNCGLAQAVYTDISRFSGREVLDLYCGSGNFTLPLALQAKGVTAVELARESIQTLKENALANGLDNIRALCGQAERLCIELSSQGYSPDYCLIDPPRSGAAEVLHAVAKMKPERIAYVSCAPPTLVRDLQQLSQEGYSIESLRIADMFPQTAHVEALAFLTR
jgi:23S rRNA (uracil1939-C5)-methyltransferase